MEPGGSLLGAAVSEEVRLTSSETYGPGDSLGFFVGGDNVAEPSAAASSAAAREGSAH
jgi:hypothetical protein